MSDKYLFGYEPEEKWDRETHKQCAKFYAEHEYVFFRSSASELFEGYQSDDPVVLTKYLEDILGHFPVHKQTIGDCVSHGWGSGVDVLAAVEIMLKKENEKFEGQAATESIYALSRVEIGNRRLGRGDGSMGFWAAKAVSDYGILLRKDYGVADFRTYDGNKARKLGYDGLPDTLEPVAREHPVKTTSLVRSFEEAKVAIQNGYPVAVCSTQGFSSSRDSQGFSRASGSWNHCMLFCGVRMDRPGLLCLNSWGTSWISGPKVLGQPEGSFWVDADVATSMLRRGDSFSMSNYVGYPKRKLTYNFW